MIATGDGSLSQTPPVTAVTAPSGREPIAKLTEGVGDSPLEEGAIRSLRVPSSKERRTCRWACANRLSATG